MKNVAFSVIANMEKDGIMQDVSLIDRMYLMIFNMQQNIL